MSQPKRLAVIALAFAVTSPAGAEPIACRLSTAECIAVVRALVAQKADEDTDA